MEKRISEAFGGATRAEIAEKMEVNYQTLSNWLKGRTEFPASELAKIAKLTDFSLNWILTGIGEKRVAQRPLPQLFSFDEDAFMDLIRGNVNRELREAGLNPEHLKSLSEERIRAIVREEMPPKDLGTIDEFLADAIRRHDDPSLVLQDWCKREGWPIEELSGYDSSGWDSMTLQEKIDDIKEFREELGLYDEIDEILTPKDSQST